MMVELALSIVVLSIATAPAWFILPEVIRYKRKEANRIAAEEHQAAERRKAALVDLRREMDVLGLVPSDYTPAQLQEMCDRAQRRA